MSKAQEGHNCFYSKLVRLKVPQRHQIQMLPLVFLFQTGSIKSIAQMNDEPDDITSFYSKLVRLKASAAVLDRILSRFSFYSKLVRLKAVLWRFGVSHKFVSIPNWFD